MRLDRRNSLIHRYARTFMEDSLRLWVIHLCHAMLKALARSTSKDQRGDRPFRIVRMLREAFPLLSSISSSSMFRWTGLTFPIQFESFTINKASKKMGRRNFSRWSREGTWWPYSYIHSWCGSGVYDSVSDVLLRVKFSRAQTKPARPGSRANRWLSNLAKWSGNGSTRARWETIRWKSPEAIVGIR